MCFTLSLSLSFGRLTAIAPFTVQTETPTVALNPFLTTGTRFAGPFWKLVRTVFSPTSGTSRDYRAHVPIIVGEFCKYRLLRFIPSSRPGLYADDAKINSH